MTKYESSFPFRNTVSKSLTLLLLFWKTNRISISSPNATQTPGLSFFLVMALSTTTRLYSRSIITQKNRHYETGVDPERQDQREREGTVERGERLIWNT